MSCIRLLFWVSLFVDSGVFGRYEGEVDSDHRLYLRVLYINWVAVKELELSCHNGYIYIHIVSNRISQYNRLS